MSIGWMLLTNSLMFKCAPKQNKKSLKSIYWWGFWVTAWNQIFVFIYWIVLVEWVIRIKIPKREKRRAKKNLEKKPFSANKIQTRKNCYICLFKEFKTVYCVLSTVTTMVVDYYGEAWDKSSIFFWCYQNSGKTINNVCQYMYWLFESIRNILFIHESKFLKWIKLRDNLHKKKITG